MQCYDVPISKLDISQLTCEDQSNARYCILLVVGASVFGRSSSTREYNREIAEK